MLRVFGAADVNDDEDCWTQPARKARQYVSALEWDLTTQLNRAAILAETNDTLRRMISAVRSICLSARPSPEFVAVADAMLAERKRGGAP